MKKFLILTFLSLIVILSGCSSNQISLSQQTQQVTQEQKSENAINTYRDTRLLFQINYPRNWHITDYINYDLYPDKCVVFREINTISEKYGKDMNESCGEGTSFQIANAPAPFGGWNISTMPVDFNSIYVDIYPFNTYVQDYDADEPTAFIKEKKEIEIPGSKNKMTILVYESKDYSKDDMEYPHIKGMYYGDRYTYVFTIRSENIGARLSPNDANLKLFKEVLSTFQEIK